MARMSQSLNHPRNRSFSRRAVLGWLGAVSTLGAYPHAHAAAILTPRQSRGPFYPLSLPLDSDNDLVHVDGRDATADGEITDIYGRVLDASTKPLPGVRVEIWQCDANGRYHHPRDDNATLDQNFQGYGQYRTGADGGYRFRTIKPVPYPGRTPHIHFALSGDGVQPLVTQMYLQDEPGNASDSLFKSLGGAGERLLVELRRASQAGARYEGEFDIILARLGT